ncbi:MAG TPA: hypothetical protein VF808_13890 [Ktedonobacterales bacterium]
MSPMTGWENFYVIVGSSAGALTGLTFVVISLMQGMRAQGASWGVAAYTTPTVVHFGTAVVVSALLSAPWPALWQASLALALVGIAGIVYCAVVSRRMGRPVTYAPVAEDWIWFVIVPLVAYIAVLGAALFLPDSPTPALFALGGALLLLLIMGIHNAWDLVTFIAIEGAGQRDSAAGEPRQPGGAGGE